MDLDVTLTRDGGERQPTYADTEGGRRCSSIEDYRVTESQQRTIEDPNALAAECAPNAGELSR